jgi:hypothetical protein
MPCKNINPQSCTFQPQTQPELQHIYTLTLRFCLFLVLFLLLTRFHACLFTCSPAVIATVNNSNSNSNSNSNINDTAVVALCPLPSNIHLSHSLCIIFSCNKELVCSQRVPKAQIHLMHFTILCLVQHSPAVHALLAHTLCRFYLQRCCLP